MAEEQTRRTTSETQAAGKISAGLHGITLHNTVLFIFYLDGLGSLACAHSEL
jgi:hypothetical protein